MHCEELDRLLDAHSALTMEYFRQDGRTQEFYACDEEWVAECKRLQDLEEQLDRVATELADHRRRHGCGGTEGLQESGENNGPHVHLEKRYGIGQEIQ
jgi:DNA phosphorothioation-dependent restriction protein DptG